jgi:hypothetical protein
MATIKHATEPSWSVLDRLVKVTVRQL